MNRRWTAACAAAMVFTLLPAAAGQALPPARRGELGRRILERELGVRLDEPAPSPEPETVPAAAVSPQPESPPPSAAPETAPADASPEPEAETEEKQPAPMELGERVQNRTSFTPDLAALAAEPLVQRLPRDRAQILILHTHGTEAYTPCPGEEYTATDPYRTTDPTRSVIRVGDVLQQALEAQGFTVVHDRTLCDYPGYAGAYERSRAAAERALAEHPDIGVIIDLHRDALGGEEPAYRTLSAAEDGGTARVMLVIGTGENGLEHPGWRENLKLALALELAMDRGYPSLARPVQLVKERYNQHLSPGAFILEVGTNGDTLSEAERAVKAFAEAAGPVFASLLED